MKYYFSLFILLLTFVPPFCFVVLGIFYLFHARFYEFIGYSLFAFIWCFALIVLVSSLRYLIGCLNEKH